MIRSPRVRRIGRFAVVVVVLLMISACSNSGPKLYPVTGQLFYGEEPAEGATVVLHLKDGPANAPKPAGTVGADGAFKLNTHPHGEGAPAGDYIVVVTWFPEGARALGNPKNKLPESYALPTTSPLTATVQEGATTLEPIRIPSKKK